VFAYDLKDTINSYRGEPATNSQNADISSMTQVGFDNWGCYDGSPPYHTWGTNQSKTLVTMPGPFGTSVNAMLYHNFNGGFYGPTDWGAVPNGTITSGRTYTVQGWVKAADSESVGKSVNVHTYYNHSGGAYSAGTSYTLTDQWQLVSHTHTAQYNASGDGVMYFFTQNSGEVKMHLTMTGVFLDESHAVQWLVGGSTRSDTQGLIDLTGNSTMNISGVSFNSNAIMTFDGTNDYFEVPYSTTLNTPNGCTYELIVYRSNGGTMVSRGTSDSGATPDNPRLYIYPTNGQIYFDWSYSGRDIYGYTNTNMNNNTYYHLTVTATPGGYLKCYLNSIDVTGPTYGGTLPNPLPNTSDPIQIGGSTWAGYFSGNIPVLKVYNRALTSTEITNNYLKYKRQYGLT
jgi:hypothetical protein